MPTPQCPCFGRATSSGWARKFGCGAACGACTVHLDGHAIRSCITPISEADGKELTTIEAATDGNDRVGAAVHAASTTTWRSAVTARAARS